MVLSLSLSLFSFFLVLIAISMHHPKLALISALPFTLPLILSLLPRSLHINFKTFLGQSFLAKLCILRMSYPNGSIQEGANKLRNEKPKQINYSSNRELILAIFDFYSLDCLYSILFLELIPSAPPIIIFSFLLWFPFPFSKHPFSWCE